jgi:aminoglycoside phosphotransferase (APT) family kinase protein
VKRQGLIIDCTLLHSLIVTQFPQWKSLPIEPILPGGWDNKIFRLGVYMLARLPSATEYADQIKKEYKWLPRLAPLLPLSIPTPLAIGQPGNGYSWEWSVYSWIEGKTAASICINNLDDFAIELAQFLIALQQIDTTGGPLPGLHNFYRGGELLTYDAQTHQAVALLKDKIDTELAIEVWETALNSTWQHLPVWVHGDISAGNLIVQEGKLNAVIDFGGLAIGDPACDLTICWTFLDSKRRKIFREMLPLDAGTWARGRGWALWKSLIVASGLLNTNSIEASQCWYTIGQVLDDYKKQKVKYINP